MPPLDKRLLPDWIVGYLEYTASHEAPESLHLWNALVAISAASRRKVYIDLEQGPVFPNLYVIIVAESARVRKSASMALGRDLLIDAVPDVRIMRDSMTSQGLIKALNHRVQVLKGDKLVEELRSDVVIYADEVANLFSYERVRAAQMVIFLTRAYESPAIYDHTTVRDSVVRLHNLYPVMIGGTDPSNLKVLPPEAIGGLTGRLIWVVEGQRRANNPGWKRDSARAARRTLLREALIHDLRRIGNLAGEMRVDADAMDFYDNWYEELAKRDARDPETDAFYHRCHTTALHVGILLAMAHGDELRMTCAQMRAAIGLVEQQLPEVKRVTMWSGPSLFEQHRARCLSFLMRAGGVATRQQLLKHMGMPAQDFDAQLVATLVQDGSIRVQKIKNQIVIELTREGYGRLA